MQPRPVDAFICSPSSVFGLLLRMAGLPAWEQRGESRVSLTPVTSWMQPCLKPVDLLQEPLDVRFHTPVCMKSKKLDYLQ